MKTLGVVDAMSAAAIRSRTQPKVHLARLHEVPIPDGFGGGSFLYPESKALCGKRTWGPANPGSADCQRCLTLIYAEAAS